MQCCCGGDTQPSNGLCVHIDGICAKGLRKRWPKKFLDFPFALRTTTLQGPEAAVLSLVAQSSSGVQVRVEAGSHLLVALQSLQQRVFPLLDYQSILVTLLEKLLELDVVSIGGVMDVLEVNLGLVDIVRGVDLLLRVGGVG